MGGQLDLELTMRRYALRDDQWDRMIARRWARRGTRRPYASTWPEALRRIAFGSSHGRRLARRWSGFLALGGVDGFDEDEAEGEGTTSSSGRSSRSGARHKAMRRLTPPSATGLFSCWMCFFRSSRRQSTYTRCYHRRQ